MAFDFHIEPVNIRSKIGEGGGYQIFFSNEINKNIGGSSRSRSEHGSFFKRIT